MANQFKVALCVSIFIALILNPLLIAWQAWYVSCTINPLSHQSDAKNQERRTLESEFIALVLCGLGAILLNGHISVGMVVIAKAHGEASRHMQRIPKHVLTAILIAIGIVLTFGQLVSPFISPDLAWRSKYRHTCDGMDVRIHLDSAEARHSPMVRFSSQSTGESYMMMMEPDPEVWGLKKYGTYNFTLVEGTRKEGSTFVPTWSHISYSRTAERFSVYNNNNNTSIMSGDYSLGKDFSIPALNIVGDLGPFAERCVFDPTAEIYDKDVRYENGRVVKHMVMKTAQFKICDLLQVCADEYLGDMTAVPVGLLMLQRAGRPSQCCRGRVIPGVAGRDKGRFGNG